MWMPPRMSQARSASYRPQIGGAEEEPVAADFAWIEVEPTKTGSRHPSGWEKSPTLKEEEIYSGRSVALFDYLRKSIRGVLSSRSAGARIRRL